MAEAVVTFNVENSEAEAKEKFGKKCSNRAFLYFQSVFNTIDTNKDGFISLSEFKEFLDANEQTNFPEKVVHCVYKNYDINKDEKLDFYEFLEMITDPEFKSAFEKVTERILKFIVAPSRSDQRDGHIILKKTITNTGIYEKAYSFRNIFGLPIITVLQILIYYSDSKYKDPTEQLGPWSKVLIFHHCHKVEIYRYVSYLFLHNDKGHLYGNVILQLLIGIPLEMVHSWRVLLIYFAGALGGSITSSVIYRNLLTTGASGAVFSLYTSHIAAVIMNWKEMSHPSIHLMIFGTLIAITGIYDWVISSNASINYADHGGGCVVGLLLGILVLKNLKDTKREEIFWHVGCITLGLYALTMIMLDICLPVEVCLFKNLTSIMMDNTEIITTTTNNNSFLAI